MAYSYSAPDKDSNHANFTTLTQIFDSNFQNISTKTSNLSTLSTNMNSIPTNFLAIKLNLQFILKIHRKIYHLILYPITILTMIIYLPLPKILILFTKISSTIHQISQLQS